MEIAVGQSQKHSHVVGFDFFEIRKNVLCAVGIALQEIDMGTLHFDVRAVGINLFGNAQSLREFAVVHIRLRIIGGGIKIDYIQEIIQIAVGVGMFLEIQHKAFHSFARIVESAVVHNGVKVSSEAVSTLLF